MSKKISVLGDGAWGTAIASLLANNGYEIILWCHNPDICKSINLNNYNNIYFPDLKLSSKIKATTDLKESLQDSDWIFEAIPVKFLRQVLCNAIPYFNKEQIWVILSKGIENDTFFVPSQIIDDIFKENIKKAILCGPTFANELVEQKISAINLAASNNLIAEDLTKILQNNYFKIEPIDDLIGIQIAAALKNLFTISLGIAQGLNYADNTKAYLFTICLKEFSFLINYFGGQKDTVLSLAGIGDLILSSFGKHSKNLNLGIQLGQGRKLNELYKGGALPEGINTIQSVYQFISTENLDLPLIKSIYRFIFEDKEFNDYLKSC